MSTVIVTLPDGSQRSVPRGTPVREFAASVLPQSVMKKALAAEVGGQLVDLSFPLNADAPLRIVTPEAPGALALYRHSTAHLLAAAVTQLFPEAQCGIGPATDEGFFYDFVVSRPFVPEDLEKIEARMRELAGQDLRYERQLWPREEAIAFFRGRSEPLKVQLIEEKTAGQPTVSCYTIKDRDTFVDSASARTCRPPDGSRPSRCCPRPARTGRATHATSRCSASTARLSSRKTS
jgi:threonyl-tRNA synthetase